jgi:ribosome-associated heat shock protein Hsp15
VNGLPAKASREIHIGEVLTVRKLPVIYTYKVKQLTEKRLPAKLVENFYIDQTSPEELEKLKINDVFFIKRDRGSGRPTKRERRILDKWRNN